MLRRITPQQLAVGMYIHSISGDWMSHPFWRKSFKIESRKDIQMLRQCDAGDIFIDTDKGRDIPAIDTTDAPASMAHSADSCADILRSASQQHGDDSERERAARLLAASQPIVLNMFCEARMGRAVNIKDVGELVTEIADSVSRNTEALISLARLKNADNYTYMHSVAVCAMMIALARQLGMSSGECKDAGMAGLLHDVGKMSVPAELLNKPARLTDEEFASVRAHTIRGHAMLHKIYGICEAAKDVALHHHEKVDGSGYPHNLKAEQISVMARMGAICDVYDAITSNRPYKAGWDPAQSIRHMANSAGHFDATMLSAFVKAIGIYPSGSVVLMKSGRLAVVLEQAPEQLLKPRVQVFFSTARNMPIAPEIIDLARSSDRIVSCADPAKWGIQDIPAVY